MENVKNLIGKKFGRWEIVSIAYIKNKENYLNVKCICGIKKIVLGKNILSGRSKSCGCFKKEKNNEHGFSKHPLIKIINNQRNRCKDPNAYGERGIKFNFTSIKEAIEHYETLGPAPSPQHTLDRKNNDGHYEKGNVVWSTKTEQVLNTRKRKNTKSNYRGIGWDEYNKKWGARLTYNKKVYFLGRFNSEIEAANIYLQKYFELYNKWPPEYSKTPLCYKTPLHYLGLIK